MELKDGGYVNMGALFYDHAELHCLRDVQEGVIHLQVYSGSLILAWRWGEHSCL
jgi:hypothetical protein